MLEVGRLPGEKRKPIVYVDYVETAPWNVKNLMKAGGGKPQFATEATRLVEAAVCKSLEVRFKRGVALHSLPGAERFYLAGCGMTAHEQDPDKENL